jgi:hypothetical protein
MLAGLKAGQVHLLRRNRDTGQVEVSRNESDIIGWSADEILRSFLDVPAPTDLESARHAQRLQELREKEHLTAAEEKELEELRHIVSEELLGGPPIAAELARLRELLVREQDEEPYGAEKRPGKKPGGRRRKKQPTDK